MKRVMLGTVLVLCVVFVVSMTATSYAQSTLMVVRAADDSLWKATCEGDVCTVFSGFPGMFGYQPTLTWDESLEEWVIVGTASDNTIWRATFDKYGNFNNDWMNIPGATPSPVGVSGGNSSVVNNISYINASGDTMNGPLSVNSILRVQNYTWPSTGKSLEMAYSPGLNKGYIQVYDRDTSTWGDLYLGDGNVGIGTINPSSKFVVSGVDPYITLDTTGTGMETGIKMRQDGADKWTIRWMSAFHRLSFSNGSKAALSMEESTGNVGVGLAANKDASEQLVVQGNLRVQDTNNTKALRLRTTGGALDFDLLGNSLYFSGDSGTIMLLHNTRKNVGINTTDPDQNYKLEVKGAYQPGSFAASFYNGQDSGWSRAKLGGTVTGVAGEGTFTGFWASGGDYDYYAFNHSYGPFTGAHEVKIADSFPRDVSQGMIVSVTGETKARKEGDGVSISSTIPTVVLSSKEEDKAVFGAFFKEGPLPEGHWYHAKQGERFGIVNALGEGRVWVSNISGEIEAGDYITTSQIPGYGQLQDDDVLHTYTLGKATETVDWAAVKDTVERDGRTYKAYLIAVVYTSG